MLAAVFLVNAKGSYVVRPLVPLDKEKTAEIIDTFIFTKSKTTEQKGLLSTKIGDFFYQEIDELSLGVFGDGEDPSVFKGMQALEVGIRAALRSPISLDSYGSEMADVISLVDEIFSKEGAIDRSSEEVLKVLNFQSNDELLHDMLERNRKKEIEKSRRQMKKLQPAISELTKEIEEIKILKETLQTREAEEEAPKQRTKTPSAFRVKEAIESLSNKVNLVSHQRLVSTFNASTETSKTEGTGELLVKITDDEFAKLKIALSSKPGSARPHPSIDKTAFASGSILPKVEFPLERALTLLKWTVENPGLPFEVSFWQTEISEERYRFFVEITALSDIKNISLKISAKRLSDIEVSNGHISSNHIVAESEDLLKDQTLPLEFSALCDEVASLFPFTIFYTIESEATLQPISVTSVKFAASDSNVQEEDVSLCRIIEGECTVIFE